MWRVAEQGHHRMAWISDLEGVVQAADLGRIDPVPGRFLDREVAPQRRVALGDVDPVGHA